jgi:hypothetical protein
MVRGCGRPAAPHRWLADVVARHGHQLGDGTFRLGSTQAELAADAGCSSGTIQARISVLEAEGLVLTRRPLTVRLPLGVTPTVTQPERPAGPHRPTATGSVSRPVSTEPAPAASSGALTHLLAANASLAADLAACPTADLLEAQQAVLAALSTLSRIREGGPADPRANAAVPRRPVAVPRLSVGESVSQDLKLSKNTPTDSLTPQARIRGSANHQSRIREEPATTAPEIDELVQPLVDLADRCGLIGVTDRTGLHKALSPYRADQIRHAVSQITRMTKAGKIASPLGWLIAAAGRGDPDLFTTTKAPTRRPPTRDPEREQSDPSEDPAEQALTRADPDELARIDDHIRTAAHFAPILHRILDQPDALHTARLEAWRALQQEAS